MRIKILEITATRAKFSVLKGESWSFLVSGHTDFEFFTKQNPDVYYYKTNEKKNIRIK